MSQKNNEYQAIKDKSSKNSLISSNFSNNKLHKNSINYEENENFEKKNSKNEFNQNESLSISMNNQQNPNEINSVETPKDAREKYKKINKDKNYSRSIDGNIPKQKYAQYQLGGGNVNNVYSANDVNKNKNSNIAKKK